MENNPTTQEEQSSETVESTDAVTTEAVENPATEAPSNEEVENSTSQEETVDYSALIEEEKKRGPDPEKAKERFEKKRQKEQKENGT